MTRVHFDPPPPPPEPRRRWPSLLAGLVALGLVVGVLILCFA